MTNISRWYKQLVGLITFTMLSVISYAQEKGVDINVDVKKEGEWYQQTWVWILGGAIFVLLLVALLRGGGKKDA